MEKIVGVKFKEGGKVYYFSHGDDEYVKNQGVIVETARGQEYAIVVIPYAEIEAEKLVAPLKPVVRKANKKDEEIVRKNEERKPEAEKIFLEKVKKFNLPMKLIDCEFTFDGTKVVFYFSSEGRVDFRELVKDLSSVFRLRIELRQVGIRDEIRMLGGIAPCGRECCCSSCMPEIKKVSIKMAKNQGLSLNPVKISGLCGRLMCCLSYENDYYAEIYKKMPKVGSEVITPDGAGIAVNVDMLKQTAKVRIENKDVYTYRDYAVADLKFKRAVKEEKEDAIDPELKKLQD